MPKKSIKGYSFLIRPLQMVLDVIIICLIVNFFIVKMPHQYFYIYIISAWLLSALIVDFYIVYRFTSAVNILILLFKQALGLSIALFAFYGIVGVRLLSIKESILMVSLILIVIGVLKFGVYYSLKQYRKSFGGNKRRIIVFGSSSQAQELISFFNSKPDMGYSVQKVFSNNIQEGITYLKENALDELYCSMDEVSDNQVNEIVNFCNLNEIVLKFIPNDNKLPVTKLQTDYYHYLPVVSIPKMPLHLPQNIALKRVVDIIISTLVILLILSWLTPLMFLIIKIESKGPLFYKHKRNGINYGEFTCYKFRSLKQGSDEDRLHVSKKDERVTKVGRFLRRTSIDEIPQFFNVLIGNMSVVGPRPHIPRYTSSYAKKIDKYEFVYRHSVKPGITGLSQIKGYRGEIKSDVDIINRIKFDVFYIQNWSLIQDINIILNTIVLVFKGQDQAY